MVLLPLVLVIVQGPVGQPAAVVTVRATSEVSGSVFRLAEIAEITASDPAQAARLGAVEVGAAPLPGLSRGLFAGDIMTRLRAARVDPRSIKLVTPPSIRVTRSATQVPPEGIVAAARAALGEPGPDMQFEPLPLSVRLFMPPGNVEMRAGAPRGRPESGSVTVPVDLVAPGAPTRTVDVAFRVRHSVEAVVATRMVEAGAILAAEDLAVGRVERPASPTALARDPADLIGQRASRRFMAGQPVLLSAVAAPSAIESGARVRVESVAGGVSIAGTGLARSSGAVGDVIRVFVQETRREVHARIVDATTVRVEEGR